MDLHLLGVPLRLLGISASRTNVAVDEPVLYVLREELPSVSSQAPSVKCGTNGTEWFLTHFKIRDLQVKFSHSCLTEELIC